MDVTLTFAEAMALDQSDVEASWGRVWLTMRECADSHTLADFRTAKFRRARPRKSRVQEMNAKAWPDVKDAVVQYEDLCQFDLKAREETIRAVCEHLRKDADSTSLDCRTADDIERHFLEPR